jgi:hypothetical protein
MAATGAKRSRPWKRADRRSGFQSMSHFCVFPARRWTSSNRPLPGPTYHRPSALRIMAGRIPPTPGSTTQRKMVPAGNHAAYAANRQADAFGLPTGASAKKVDNGYARRPLMQHRLHLTRIGAVQPEIREQHNQVINSSAVLWDASHLRPGRLAPPRFAACPPARGSGPRSGKGQIGQRLLASRCHQLDVP